MRIAKRITAALSMASILAPSTVPHSAMAASDSSARTPIKHVIIIVGENHTFDNVYGTYQPGNHQSVDNLLSKGIVNADGTPGPNFGLAAQGIGQDLDKYHPVTATVGRYATLPQPYTTYAAGQPQGVPDTRFPSDLPNGPFQISRYVPYASFTGDPVHRFFQMWQDVDGGQMDKFAWVEQTIGTGSNGAPPPAGGFNPKEGAISMGFNNMNPYVDAHGAQHSGDAPVFKQLADEYAMSDNYHQAIMGGTGANFQAIISGDVAFFTDLQGNPAVPFPNQIENPDPFPGTNNYYKQDGYGGGSYVECSNSSEHTAGVEPINYLLGKNGVRDNRCAPHHYYLVNNYSMYWNEDGTTNQLGPDKFVLPPQSNPTIVDALNAKNVSWKYYTGDRGSDKTNFANSVDGIPLAYHSYCGICDPLTGYKQIMTTSESAKLQNYGAFLNDVQSGQLPAVSFVRPFEYLAGHPAGSHLALYEAFVQDVIAKVKANKALWNSTAIFVTMDEGGGYYDSGFIQRLDFFGDGTRIPFVVVSPWAKKGFVDHTYYDHVSMLKFIEANWSLPKISQRSRDNLPNPEPNTYRPGFGPAIGDLMNLFIFTDRQNGGLR